MIHDVTTIEQMFLTISLEEFPDWISGSDLQYVMDDLSVLVFFFNL